MMRYSTSAQWDHESPHKLRPVYSELCAARASSWLSSSQQCFELVEAGYLGVFVFRVFAFPVEKYGFDACFPGAEDVGLGFVPYV